MKLTMQASDIPRGLNSMPANCTTRSATRLREVSKVLSQAIETLASEWESSENSNQSQSGVHIIDVSRAQYDASRIIQAALGSLESLVVPPHNKLTSLAMSYTICRALHLVAEHNIAEILSQVGDEGMSGTALACSTGLEAGKLCEWLVVEFQGMINITN